jgi:hypothetical protein
MSIPIVVEAMRWDTPSTPPKIPIPVYFCPRIHQPLIYPLILPPLVATTLISKSRVRRTPSPSLVIIPPKSLTCIPWPALLVSSMPLSPTIIVGSIHAPSKAMRTIPSWQFLNRFSSSTCPPWRSLPRSTTALPTSRVMAPFFTTSAKLCYRRRRNALLAPASSLLTRIASRWPQWLGTLAHRWNYWRALTDPKPATLILCT